MKEFFSAAQDIVDEDAAKDREAAIEALVKDGQRREDAEREVDFGKPVEFKLDGREYHAYPPAEGQLVFMVASLGRGQSAQGRVAGIINVISECLRSDDRDAFEARMLTQGKDRISVDAIEGVFEYLSEEWFARPTQ